MTISYVSLAESQQFWRNECSSPTEDWFYFAEASASQAGQSRILKTSVRLGVDVSKSLIEASNGEDGSVILLTAAASCALLARLAVSNHTDGHSVRKPLIFLPSGNCSSAGLVPYLAIRGEVDSDTTFASLARQVRDKAVKAESHAIYELDDLLAEFSTEPLLQVVLSDEAFSRDKIMLTAKILRGGWILCVSQQDERIDFDLHHAEPFASTSAAQAFLQCLAALLKPSLEDPRSPITHDLISEREEYEILKLSTGPAIPSGGGSVLDMFERQAGRTPDATALATVTLLPSLYGSGTERLLMNELTYKDANDRANRIASTLCDLGVESGDIVALLIDNPLDKAPAIFGVMKTDAIYLPLDVSFSVEMIKDALARARAKVLITDVDSARKADLSDVRVLFLPSELVNNRRADFPTNIRRCEHVYVCATSGSTGPSKLVLVSARGLANYVDWRIRELSFDATVTALQLVPYSADGFCSNFFPTLCSGGRVVLFKESDLSKPDFLIQSLRYFNVSMTSATPTALEALVDCAREGDLASCNTIIFGGEVASEALFLKLAQLMPHATLCNEYGPTEATVAATFNGRLAASNKTNIGQPIANITALVLSSAGVLLPIGFCGEICLTGDSIAAGYLDDPHLTSIKFVHHPKFGPMYRTGDLGRWEKQGHLRYLRRLDSQIKVRGRRADLQCIEEALRSLPQVHEANVMAADRGGTTSSAEIVSIVTVCHPISPSQIQSELRKILPAWMIPEKIFTSQLDPDLNTKTADTQEALSDPIEIAIVDIFAEVLEINANSVTRDATFFELGGHSLKIVQVAGHVHAKLGTNLRLSALYECPTVRGIASLVRAAAQPKAAQSHPNIDLPFELSDAQRRMYLMRRIEPTGVGYNVPVLAYAGPLLDFQQVLHALRLLLERHSSLRTGFETREKRIVQFIAADCQPILETYNMSIEEFRAFSSRFRKPFNLERPPIFRACLVNLEGRESRLLFDTHHIVADGASVSLLKGEFLKLYNGASLGPAVQYSDYVFWRRSREVRHALRVQEQYWMRTLANYVLPRWRQRFDENANLNEGGFIYFELSSTEALPSRNLARELNSSISAVLLALFKGLLACSLHSTDIIVTQSVAARPLPEFNSVVGMFVNMLPIRTHPKQQTKFRDYVNEVSEQVTSAFRHQEFPFDELVDRLGFAGNRLNASLFDITFQFSSSGSSLESRRDMLRSLDHEVCNYASDLVNFGIKPPTSLLLWVSEEADGSLAYVIGHDATVMSRHDARVFGALFSEALKSLDRTNQRALVDLFSEASSFHAHTQATKFGYRFS
jgi:amino acid adenylation domain-containing protein